MVPNITLILQAVLDDYALPWGGYHGVAHWARVLENGLRLAEETGANVEVVRLFAVLHDSRRINEGHDPDHGPRAAEFARSSTGSSVRFARPRVPPAASGLSGHTHERTHPDVTIQTCWDADRLDLGRVGITPHPSHLCTEVARRPETIRWADGRARFRVVPEIVWEEWGIDLGAVEAHDIEDPEEGGIEWPSE